MVVPRAYKEIPGLTERCKELAQAITRYSWPQPRKNSEIPFRIQQRIYAKRGRITLIRCSHCGEPEAPYRNALDSFREGVCQRCSPLYTRTMDGLHMLRERCWTDSYGDLWSSADASEYQDDDDDYSDDVHIAEYHCHPSRSSKMKFHTPDHDDPWAKDAIYIGFEWEYNSISGSRRRADSDGLDRTDFCFGETDGSLSGSRGLEVVTGWSTLGTVCRWARDIGTLIRVGDIEDAGLHVNVSGLTNLQMAKYITFLSRNANLTTKVGGRANTGYARVQSGKLSEWLMKTRRHGYRELGSTAPPTDKYSFCNIRDSRAVAEVRIFNSSKSADEIVQRIQYAWAVAQFVRQPGMNLGEKHFKAFLAENPWVVKGCRDLLKAFPELCPAAFAKRPKKVPA